MNYFWTIHEKRFMLVATVPTYCVTWDNCKAGPIWLEHCDILVRVGCGTVGAKAEALPLAQSLR
jgi:hypothetical protein